MFLQTTMACDFVRCIIWVWPFFIGQDFDEKRREWRRTKKNVINAISEMSARALKFECSERKTIALHAIQYYKVRGYQIN